MGGVFSVRSLFYFSEENQVRKTFKVESGGFFKKVQKIKKEDIIKDLKAFRKTEFVMPNVDVSGWKTYRSNWYGFKVRYPVGWEGPILKSAKNGSDWEYRYSFRKLNSGDVIEEEGFNITVYNIKNVGEVFETEEYLSGDVDTYTWQDKHLPKKRDFAARQVYSSSEDGWVQGSFFFFLSRKDKTGQYIYKLEPLNKTDYEVRDARGLAKKHLPEFFGVASSFNLTDIDRPTLEEIARAKAPLPLSFKWESSRRVCAKKNDKPGKSKKGKGHHLDMECCLDPDEDPNPHCYYPPGKYSKL